MKNSFLAVLFLITCLAQPSFAKNSSSSQASSEEQVDKHLEKLIGTMIRSRLAKFHYTQKSLDDALSEKAFPEFLKRFDYNKQYFLKSDVKKLEKYRFLMDDQMTSAKHELVDQTVSIFKQRIKNLNKLREKLFKKEFTFKKKESLELDGEKRDYFASEKALNEHWRKIFKQSVLSNYISIMDAQKELKNLTDKTVKAEKKDKKKKKKKEEILTDKQMRAKAQKSQNEKYEKYFTRLLKDRRTDNLEKFFNAVAAVHDPHTVYFPPKKKEDFDIDISGQLEGIGAVLQEDGAYIKVNRIVPGGAAWRQKQLEVDDVILFAAEKDGTPVDLVNMRVDDAVRYIRGKKGTEVRLTVKKADGSRAVIPIIRDVVEIEASYAKASILKHKKLDIKVGYIHVPKFYRDFNSPDRSCTADVLMELKRLKKSGIDGMILDLRNNGGGALQDAEEMSGLFIEKGPIVQIRDPKGQIDVLRDSNPDITYDGPLIVMVNRFSASASEILAGAMQDYKRAVIVGGEHTHGKGTVQAILRLNGNQMLNFLNKPLGAMKITVQKFYRITGGSTQYKGITPDIILPDPMGYAENREQDLDYSIPWDKVKAQSYDEWEKFAYQLPILKTRSGKRVGKSDRFRKITESVDYLKKRKDDTKVSLNLKEVLSQDEANKKITEKLKNEEESKDIVVSNFEESLLAHSKVQESDKKRWMKDFEKKKKDWVKSLTVDPMIEETLFIMDDVIRQLKGKKLSMVK